MRYWWTPSSPPPSAIWEIKLVGLKRELTWGTGGQNIEEEKKDMLAWSRSFFMVWACLQGWTLAWWKGSYMNDQNGSEGRPWVFKCTTAETWGGPGRWGWVSIVIVLLAWSALKSSYIWVWKDFVTNSSFHFPTVCWPKIHSICFFWTSWKGQLLMIRSPTLEASDPDILILIGTSIILISIIIMFISTSINLIFICILTWSTVMACRFSSYPNSQSLGVW